MTGELQIEGLQISGFTKLRDWRSSILQYAILKYAMWISQNMMIIPPDDPPKRGFTTFWYFEPNE